MGSYDALARCYDSLTTDVDYSAWADYIESVFKNCGKEVKTVLDLACGTGSLACILAQRGYDVIGVDKSEEMLAQAYDKAMELDGVRPMFLEQSMEELDLYGTVDAVVCCLDSVNYLTDKEALQEAFNRVHTFLEPEGIFVFDINSPEKFRVMDGEIYMDETDDVCCIWRVDIDGEICTYCMDIFTREGMLWRRNTEIHEERVYKPEEIEVMLCNAGFVNSKIYGDRSALPPSEGELRLFFTTRKGEHK